MNGCIDFDTPTPFLPEHSSTHSLYHVAADKINELHHLPKSKNKAAWLYYLQKEALSRGLVVTLPLLPICDTLVNTGESLFIGGGHLLGKLGVDSIKNSHYFSGGMLKWHAVSAGQSLTAIFASILAMPVGLAAPGSHPFCVCTNTQQDTHGSHPTITDEWKYHRYSSPHRRNSSPFDIMEPEPLRRRNAQEFDQDPTRALTQYNQLLNRISKI